MTTGTNRKTAFGRSGGIARAALCACAFVALPAHATTPAGTVIVNTATMTFGTASAAQTVRSNTVELVTAERIDVTVTADRDTLPVSATGDVAVGFVVTNTGNGAEDFTLAFTSDQAGTPVSRIVVDTDGNGIYDATTDQPFAASGTVSLAAGGKVRVFAIVDGTKVAAAARITARATARTGSGTPGTLIAGAGDNGSDAVIGATGATATASTTLAAAVGMPSLVKSQSVFAPDGSARAVRGAIITYSLVATLPAATGGVTVDDAIPAGTDYVAGSMQLDGAALSDARDGDAGAADTTGVHVTLGDTAAATTRTIQFSVKIQ